jgi:hypothetical protein
MMKRTDLPRTIPLFSVKNLLLASGTFLMLAGCGSNQQALRDHCLALQGVIGEEHDNLDRPYEVCITHSIASFDDGEQELEQRCELQAFFENRCAEGPGLDNVSQQVTRKQPATIHGKVDAKVKQILNNLEHTGYRTNYSSKMTDATVVIGRPLTCLPRTDQTD